MTEPTYKNQNADHLKSAQLKKKVKRGHKLPQKLLAEWLHQQVLKAGFK